MTMVADRPKGLEAATAATPEFEKAAERAASRRGFLSSATARSYAASSHARRS